MTGIDADAGIPAWAQTLSAQLHELQAQVNLQQQQLRVIEVAARAAARGRLTARSSSTTTEGPSELDVLTPPPWAEMLQQQLENIQSSLGKRPLIQPPAHQGVVSRSGKPTMAFHSRLWRSKWSLSNK